jgi:transcriptional regulator with XRE-family HTH domain
MTIGQRIVQMRGRRKLSQADLAERAQIGQSLLSKIEGGSRPNPTAEVLRKLATALGCTTDYLIGMHEETDAGNFEPAGVAMVGA